MTHDAIAVRSIPGRVRCDAGFPITRHRQHGADPRLHLGDLGHRRQLSGVAGGAGQPVRPAVGDAARQHHFIGAGLLSSLNPSMPFPVYLFQQWNIVFAHCRATSEPAL